nr:hypothetical protein [Tanacetum cinerariifolium]
MNICGWKPGVSDSLHETYIASANVGMLDKFDRGLQTGVHVLWILTTPRKDRSLSWVDKSQELRYELRLVAGIATGVLVKGGSRSEVPARVEVAAYRRIVETIHVDFDELTTMVSEQSSSGPVLNDMIPGTISSGLVQKSSSSTSYGPPSMNDWDLLFQPLFDELLNPPPSVDN